VAQVRPLNDLFGSKKTKREERKLRNLMNEFELILAQIHSLDCMIFFFSTLFSSN
jgi:hypothetical protein